MGDEADAMWDAEMIEEGREFGLSCGGQCDRWPSCACGHDTRKRPYDPCSRRKRTRKRP
jgi:hypothetical protein